MGRRALGTARGGVAGLPTLIPRPTATTTHDDNSLCTLGAEPGVEMEVFLVTGKKRGTGNDADGSGVSPGM